MNGQSRPLINLLRGWPSLSLLPAFQLQSAAQRALLTDANSALSYGPDEGYEPLRHSVAEWLSNFYQPAAGPIASDRICITGGASQSLACILQTFTDPVYTRNVWMIAPTYFLACRIIEDSGFAGRLRGVPEDAEGVDIEFLEQAIKKSEEDAMSKGNVKPVFKVPRPWRKIYRHIIYCVPTFSNPSSRVMSLSRREALVRIARKYDALLITDDVYDMLQWPTDPSSSITLPAPLPRLVDLDQTLDSGPVSPFGNAISNGSFSKIIGPGIRTGWIEATTSQLAWGVSQTGSSRSGGCPSQVAATFVHEMITNGQLDSHITDTLLPAYAKRYHLMMKTIEKHLVPLGITMPQPGRDRVGGYFIWLTLPKGLDAEQVAKRCVVEEQLTVAEGQLFRVWGDDSMKQAFTSDIRLCFAWEDEEKLVDGVERLARVVKRSVQLKGI